MDEHKISQLEEIKGPFFLYTDPEILDLSKDGNPSIVIMGRNGIIKIGLCDGIFQTIGVLKTLFKGPIFWWNAKNFYSYILYKTGRRFESSLNVLDLKVIEAYMGVRGRIPENYTEFINRVQKLRENDNWKNVYNKIHLPLIYDVVPQLENIGILDFNKKKVLRAYYEIEGQRNGRFKCPVNFSNGFNPHSIKNEEKECFRPIGENRQFLYFDFKNMEVAVLQWLSQDKNLQEILENEDDFYSCLFKLITGKECNHFKYRDFCKKVFLPVVYGMSCKSLVEKRNISTNFAEFIINKINNTFSSAMSYVQKQQDDRVTSDYLGRTREFDQYHKIRNFVIQSPAATVCFEKLIDLKQMLNGTDIDIGFHIHDGYCLYVPQKQINYFTNKAIEVLEAPSSILPGLKLKIACKTGPNLNFE
jgi:hypothetical protein